jgi:hypothetical protein
MLSLHPIHVRRYGEVQDTAAYLASSGGVACYAKAHLI